MRVSKLKHELEILELNQKHEEELMKVKHKMEKDQMLAKCTHRYDDGSSATISVGMQWDLYQKCSICGKSM